MSAIGLENIETYQGNAPKKVVQAVAQASAKTGVNFNFLMEKAAAESGFKTDAKAKTSSARGLFQFIENTWLSMVKNHGEKYGLSNYADKISIDKNGRPCVTDCDTRNAILNLRNNPEISALMAGEFTAENKAVLERATKQNVGETELYLAHFMGAGTAAKFLNSRQANADTEAAALFPAAARANKSVFYNADGSAKSLDDIYQTFAKKFGEDGTPAARPALAKQDVAEKSVAVATAAPEMPLPLFDDADKSDDIIWNDDPRFFAKSTFTASTPRIEKLSPVAIMIIADMQRDAFISAKPKYNS